MAKTAADRRDMPWQEAIQHVLKDSDSALHYTAIAERIVTRGLRRTVGATPAATVAANLSESLRSEESPYLKVGRGEYTLKPTLQTESTAPPALQDPTDDTPESGALQAFGMFWRRDLVSWSSTARLLGRQGSGATEVNFAGQVGVYLLHDRDRVIYVGRATDTLFARLKSHTTDRLNGRWDRFSWFGLRAVADDGKLADSFVPWNEDVVVETMEALLIESLEPPLNRRRGDNLAAAEYLQVADPKVEQDRRRALMEEFVKGQPA